MYQCEIKHHQEKKASFKNYLHSLRVKKLCCEIEYECLNEFAEYDSTNWNCDSDSYLKQLSRNRDGYTIEEIKDAFQIVADELETKGYSCEVGIIDYQDGSVEELTLTVIIK